eukprot:CFRG4042T1
MPEKKKKLSKKDKLSQDDDSTTKKTPEQIAIEKSEKNKKAAKEYRQKKKGEVGELERKVHIGMLDNDRLREEENQLMESNREARDEISRLEAELAAMSTSQPVVDEAMGLVGPYTSNPAIGQFSSVDGSDSFLDEKSIESSPASFSDNSTRRFSSTTQTGTNNNLNFGPSFVNTTPNPQMGLGVGMGMEMGINMGIDLGMGIDMGVGMGNMGIGMDMAMNLAGDGNVGDRTGSDLQAPSSSTTNISLNMVGGDDMGVSAIETPIANDRKVEIRSTRERLAPTLHELDLSLLDDVGLGLPALDESYVPSIDSTLDSMNLTLAQPLERQRQMQDIQQPFPTLNVQNPEFHTSFTPPQIQRAIPQQLPLLSPEIHQIAHHSSSDNSVQPQVQQTLPSLEDSLEINTNQPLLLNDEELNMVVDVDGNPIFPSI